MSTLGPSASDQNAQTELCPTCSVAVNLAADFDLTQQFACGFARELYIGVGGTVIAQLQGDAAPQTYLNVPSGSYMHGIWTLVKSTANGTLATNIIARR